MRFKTLAVTFLFSLSLISCAASDPYKKMAIVRKARAIEWTEKSEESLKLKNWSEAIRMSTAAIMIDPSYPAAYINRSWGYLEKGFYEEGLADCQKAIELDGNNSAAINNRGLLYRKKGQNDLAKLDFERSCNGGLQIGCNNFKLVTGFAPSEKVEYFLKKAEESFNSKDWDSVIKYTSEISQSDLALSIRSGAYASKGMFEDAINDCNAAIKMNPNSALAYINKGFALELMGKKKEATLNYEFACNLDMPSGCNNMNRLLSIK
jgi:Tfp pilus assembly protein PilF